MGARDFSSVKRVVVKVGTNLISRSGEIITERLEAIVADLVRLKKSGYSVLLVTSGAVGLGAGEISLAGRVKGVVMRQTCAAIGQPILMEYYRAAFARHSQVCAQILVTTNELNDRTTYVNLMNSVNSLLDHGVIPVFNENDTVSTDEVGTAVGDNDRLSAFIANKVDAQLLILLTDIEGLYTEDPKHNPHAEFLSEVPEITPSVLASAGSAGSVHSTGGMKTKLIASRIASYGGCSTIIASGYEKDILVRIVRGEDVGTHFHPLKRMSQRTRWILHSDTSAAIWIDDGAVRALRNHKSLLPSGIVRIEGVFRAGEVVMINNIAKAVPYYNSTEIVVSIGKHSSAMRAELNHRRPDVIFRPEDIVFLDHAE